MKQSFIVYTDSTEYLEELTDAQIGQLYKAQIAYSRGEEPEISDPMVRLTFKMLKAQMDRDSEKYEETVAQRKKSGTNGAKKRWQGTANDSTAMDDMAKIANAKTDMAKIANAKTDMAKIAVTVTDTVTDTVSKEKGDTNVSPKKKFVRPTLSEVQSFADEHGYTLDVQHFYDYYESNGWRVGRNAMKDWHAALRNWLKNDFDRGKVQSLPDDDLNAYMAAQAAKERAEDEARGV